MLDLIGIDGYEVAIFPCDFDEIHVFLDVMCQSPFTFVADTKGGDQAGRHDV